MTSPADATGNARERAAAARRAQQGAARRKAALLTVAAAVTVVALVAAFIALGTHRRHATTATERTALPATVTTELSHVPASVVAAVGVGSATAIPHATAATSPVTVDGKPSVLYVGAEYCPYCAAERWSLTQALSRFGTFSPLDGTTSSAIDVFPNTPTLTYHGATYTSPYLAFTGKELYTNKVAGKSYGQLDTLTPAQAARFGAGDAQRAFPFLDLAGRYTLSGSQYDPKVLAGLTQTQIAAALADPASPVTKAVVGSANLLTARLCQLTGNKPIATCTDPTIRAIRGQLHD